MKKLVAAAVSMLFAFSGTSAQAFTLPESFTVNTLIAPQSEKYFDYAMPYVMANGTVVSLFADGAQVYSVTSNDSGKTWGEAKLVRDFVNTNGASTHWQLSPTRLAITNTIMPANKPHVTFGDLVGGEMVWQEPVPVAFTDSTFSNAYTSFSSNSSGIVHMVATTGDFANQKNKRELWVKRSTDGGLTWNEMPKIATYEDNRHLLNTQSVTLADGSVFVFAEEQRIQEDTNVSQDRRMVAFTYIEGNWESVVLPGVTTFRSQYYFSIALKLAKVNSGQGFVAVYGYDDTNVHSFYIETGSATPVVNESVLGTQTRIADLDVDSNGKISLLTLSGCANFYGYCTSMNLTESTDQGANWFSIQLYVADTELSYGVSQPLFYLDSNNNRLVTFNEGLKASYTWNFEIMTSASAGRWSAPKRLFDGTSDDGWWLMGNMLANDSLVLTWTQAVNTTDYNTVIKSTTIEAPKSADVDLQNVVSFKFGSLVLTTPQKAKLRTWAQQIPADYEVKVYAPNFVEPNAKSKAKRSAARAAYVAKLLTKYGVKVVAVKGKKVQSIDALKGRNVVLRASQIDR